MVTYCEAENATREDSEANQVVNLHLLSSFKAAQERYFWTKEYNKLTHVERYKLCQLRNKRGDSGSKNKGKRQLEELSSQILELQAQLIKQN